MADFLNQKAKEQKRMGATLGHMIVLDYDVDTGKVEFQRDSIDFQASEVWKKANKNWPLSEGQTIVRITQIMGVVSPEARSLGAKADQIMDLQLKCQLNREPEHQFDFQATEFPYYLSFNLDDKRTEVYLWDHLPSDVEDGKPNETNGKTYKTVPAGTKLIFDAEPFWVDRESNNFYLETDAVKFAANLASSKFIILSEDTEMIDFENEIIMNPGEKRYFIVPGYEPTSFAQLAKLIENAQPYAGDASIPIEMKDESSETLENCLSMAEKRLMPGILAYHLAKDPLVEQDPFVELFLKVN